MSATSSTGCRITWRRLGRGGHIGTAAPVEITWPETRQLKQCIGQSVKGCRYLSERDGNVKDVKIGPTTILPACAEAALAAARHIR